MLTVAQKRARLEDIWAEAQFRRYGNDIDGFVAWCSELYWVRSKNDRRGRALFDLYPFQREAAHEYFNNKFVVCLKARQMGFTTLGMAYALWKAIYKPGGATVLVLSKTQVDARSNLQMVKHALSFFPDWYVKRMPTIEAESNDRLVLRHADNSMSVLECMVATERSGASRTADLVVADEAALWSHPDDTMRSLAPATDAAAAGDGTHAVMLVFSTARGANNYFAQLYRDAAAGRNRYRALFFPWHVNPLSNPKAGSGEIDYTVVDHRRAEFSAEPHRFFSEYPSSPEEAFMSSGHSRFVGLPSQTEFEPFPFRGHVDLLGRHASWVDDPNGNVFLSFDPREELPSGRGEVVIGADPALGVGGDSSVAYMVTRSETGLDILGYYTSNDVEPLEFADRLAALGWFFGGVHKPALLAVEFQPGGGGGGQTVVGRLRDQGYSNLYRYVQPAARGHKTLSYYGMPTTRSTKPVLINSLAEWLVPDELTGTMRLSNIPPILRDELGTFVVRPNGTVAADTGCHDDHVMATAIAVYVAAQNLRGPTVNAPRQSVTVPDGTLLLDLSQMRKRIDRQMADAKRSRQRANRSITRQMRNR